MSEQEALETAILDRYEPRWKAQGYEVLRRPTKKDLPEFLGSYRPDALVRGHSPNLVVEIVRKGQPAAQTRVRQLRDLLSKYPDWRLEVLYSGEPIDQVALVPSDLVATSLESIKVLSSSEPRAALLLSWAALEALARGLEPEQTSRPQTPGRVVELLAGAGYVVPDIADRLREIARLRNRLIHGELGVEATGDDLRTMIATIEDLIEVVRQKERSQPA